MQGGWFGAMERIHNLESRAKQPNGQNEGDQSYFCCFFYVKHMLFLFFPLRGRLSNLDKLGKITKVNMREKSRNVSFALFLSLRRLAFRPYFAS